jgi:hypothetical protein
MKGDGKHHPISERGTFVRPTGKHASCRQQDRCMGVGRPNKMSPSTHQTIMPCNEAGNNRSQDTAVGARGSSYTPKGCLDHPIQNERSMGLPAQGTRASFGMSAAQAGAALTTTGCSGAEVGPAKTLTGPRTVQAPGVAAGAAVVTQSKQDAGPQRPARSACRSKRERALGMKSPSVHRGEVNQDTLAEVGADQPILVTRAARVGASGPPETLKPRPPSGK